MPKVAVLPPAAPAVLWMLCLVGAVRAQIPVGQTAGVPSWPQVAVAAGRVHIVYAFDTFPETIPQIYVVSADAGTTVFSNPVRVALTEGAARRPAAAAGPAGTLHVAWAEIDYLLQTSTLRYTRSTDQGLAKSFASPLTIGESGLALNPRIALDEQDTPMLVWESGGNSIFERQIRFGRIAGSGVTGVRSLSAAGPVSTPNILYADGVLHVVWRQITEAQAAVYHTRSTDRGETWSTPAALPGTSTTTAPQDDFLPLFETGLNSAGVLVRDATRGSDRILYLHSSDRGASFGAATAVDGVFAPAAATAGSLARFAAREGRIAALWVGGLSGVGVVRAIHISCSLDPSRFADTRPVLELAGGVRELSASADSTGGVHAALIQVLDTGAKVIYVPARCPPRLLAEHVVNAGNQQAGGIAPGGLATAYGIDLGAAEAFGAAIDSKTGLVTATLGPTEITVDGIKAPLLFARRDQVNFQTPVEVAGLPSARVVVTVGGLSSREIVVPVTAASPAFFSLNGSGTGAVVAANQDGTFNLQNNAAPADSVVTLYATGQGVVNPAVVTGQVGPGAPPFPAPALAVTLTIGGRQADVLFAGLAPGFLGVLQLNVRIPGGLAAGPQPIRLQIGSQISATGTTIFVR